MTNYNIDLNQLGLGIQHLGDRNLEGLQIVVLFAIAERLEAIASAMKEITIAPTEIQ